MAFWQRLKEAFRPPEPPARKPGAGDPGVPASASGPGPAAARDVPPPPVSVARVGPAASSDGMPAEEAYLRQLLAQLAPEARPGLASDDAPRSGGATGAAGPAHASEPAVFQGGREFWSATDRLCAIGRERTAIELLRRFANALPEATEIAARLVELLCDRLEYEDALPFLHRLAELPAHAARAHFLLGDASDRAGDRVAARRHYERVLTLDIDYPKARLRAERMHPPGEPTRAGAAAETLAGLAGLDAAVSSRYRLRRELGRGAAGAVYLARDEELDRDVALKLLHVQGRARAGARARSFNEARIAAALRHPGVVAIYDLDEERSLIAMELCQGGTLRDRLQRGRLAPAEALHRGAELCATLEAIHRAGIVHRDLKPGNLLFRALPTLLAGERGAEASSSELVIGDFGLAHLAAPGPEGGRPDDPGAAGGTPGYMAPELRSGGVSPASDLYAVGVVLHEMLVGATPFDRAGLLRGEARFGGNLPDSVVTSLGDVVSRAIRELIERLLSSDPAARATARQARQRLEELRWLLERATSAGERR